MKKHPEYRGNRPRSTQELKLWHAHSTGSSALEPAMPIVDAHHHIFGSKKDLHHYEIEDLAKDVAVCGHNLIGTLWVEAYGQGWKASGPVELRSVGEVEGVEKITRSPIRTPQGNCEVAAGMVSNVNLMLGESVIGVLEAHIEAANGRLRGVRHHAMHDAGKVGSFVKDSRPRILSEPDFRRGVACLRRLDLVFDALVYHPQIGEVADLADAFPDQPIVLNHLGQVLGVADFASCRSEVFVQWKSALRNVALRPNVRVKIGGLGMPMFGFGFEYESAPTTAETLVQAWQAYIDVCIECFGTDRCMFESNFPVDNQSCSYLELWNAFKLATRSLSEGERRNLFYRSACQAYRLPDLLRRGDSVTAHV